MEDETSTVTQKVEPRRKWIDLSDTEKQERKEENFMMFYKGLISKRANFMESGDEKNVLTRAGKNWVKNKNNHIKNLMFTQERLKDVNITMDESGKVINMPPSLEEDVQIPIIEKYHHTKHASDPLWKLAKQLSDERSQTKQTTGQDGVHSLASMAVANALRSAADTMTKGINKKHRKAHKKRT